jgi:hypothetical protein
MPKRADILCVADDEELRKCAKHICPRPGIQICFTRRTSSNLFHRIAPCTYTARVRGTFEGHVKLASDPGKANRRPCDALLNAHEGVSARTIKSQDGIVYDPQLAAQSPEPSTVLSSTSSYRPSPSLEDSDPENLEDLVNLDELDEDTSTRYLYPPRLLLLQHQDLYPVPRRPRQRPAQTLLIQHLPHPLPHPLRRPRAWRWIFPLN